jgi:putative ABC transport system permease protein
MALGAQRSGVLKMILNRGLTLAGIGFVITAVGLILLAVSALASFAPAWRASRLDPMKTLRDQ